MDRFYNEPSVSRFSAQRVKVPDSNIYVPRPRELKSLEMALNPKYLDEGQGWSLIYGVEGCGKTTLVQQALAKRTEPVVYVNASTKADELADRMDEEMNFFSGLRTLRYWTRTLNIFRPYEMFKVDAWSNARRTFENAAARYHSESNGTKKLLLVVDSADELVGHFPEGNQILETLVKWADVNSNIMHLVLVASEGLNTTFQTLSSQPGSTVEIRDISDSEALDLLTQAVSAPTQPISSTNSLEEKLQKDNEQVTVTVDESESQARTRQRIVKEITGGRLSLVNWAAKSLREGKTYDDMKQRAINSYLDILTVNEMHEGREYDESTRDVTRAMIEHGDIPLQVFVETAERSQMRKKDPFPSSAVAVLLYSTVFHEYCDGTVGFKMRVLETMFKERNHA